MKETSKTDSDIASKNLPVVHFIDIHVNKLVSQNDTSESKDHVLLPFPYSDEHLPTKAAAGATTATTRTAQIMRMQTKTQ